MDMISFAVASRMIGGLGLDGPADGQRGGSARGLRARVAAVARLAVLGATVGVFAVLMSVGDAAEGFPVRGTMLRR